MRTTGASPPRSWRRPVSASEELQVAVELPLRDLLVRGRELRLLDAHEVVDVVLTAGVAERVAHDVVALELAGRVEEVAGQQLDAEVVALVVGELVQVELRGRLARVESLLDAVEAGGEQDRRGQVRVRRAVDRAVLDAPRGGDAQHLSAVVVA